VAGDARGERFDYARAVGADHGHDEISEHGGRWARGLRAAILEKIDGVVFIPVQLRAWSLPEPQRSF
jgi:hypothetical protein